MAVGSLFHDWEMGTHNTTHTHTHKTRVFIFIYFFLSFFWSVSDGETEEDSFVFVVCGAPWRHLDKIVPYFFFIPNEKNVVWTFIFAAFFFPQKLYYDT
jgi:hypothetical protein